MGERPLLNEDGSVTVELVLVVPLILLALVACLEVALLARARLEVVAAAREGARVAATVADPAEATTAVRAALGDPMGDVARISVSRPHVVGRRATVEVRVRRHLSTPFLSGLTVTLSGRAAMRVER